MKDLLNVLNHDTKIMKRRITLVAYFHSKEVFTAPKQAKGLISKMLKALNYFTKTMEIWDHDPSLQH